MKLLTLITGERLPLSELTELLSVLSANGVKELSFSAFAYEKELNEPGFMEAYLRLTEAAGLTFASAHGIWFHNNDLSWPDRDGRIDTVKTQQRYLERAAEAGCRTFILHPGMIFPRYSEAELWENLRESIKMLIPAAKSNNIILALENSAPGLLGSNCDELARFIRSFNSEWVGASFDAGCANISGNAVENFVKLKDLVVTAVLHDNNGLSNQHLLPGQGIMDWKSLMAQIISAPRILQCETDFAGSHDRQKVLTALNVYRALPGITL